MSKILFPVIYGHRGASFYAPENTIPAFEIALDQGADGFELDTMLTEDGVPIVIHDRSVNRTTDGFGYVDQMKVEQLTSLDAGSWFADEFKGVHIPLLDDILKIYGNRARINVELKNFHHQFNLLPERVVELVKKYGCEENILFSSFVLPNLKRIRKLLPGAQVALLYAPGLFHNLLPLKIFQFISPEFINPHFSLCSQSYILRQHNMGRRINTWTVNEEDMKRLIMNGIDGLITNDPILAVRLKP